MKAARRIIHHFPLLLLLLLRHHLHQLKPLLVKGLVAAMVLMLLVLVGEEWPHLGPQTQMMLRVVRLVEEEALRYCCCCQCFLTF